MDKTTFLNSFESNLKDLPNEFENLAELVDSYNSELKNLESTLKESIFRNKNELDALNQLRCFYNAAKLQTDTVDAEVQQKSYEKNLLINGLNFKLTHLLL